MCELMTICTASVFTVLYFRGKSRGHTNEATLTAALMFWGAALMWSVDCVAGAFEGDALLDMSFKDAILGTIVIMSGLLVFAILSHIQTRNSN